ncbi:MAG: GlcG/HbpS family heme-binding protein [Gammaproteobacteria bacterium]
MKQVFVVISTLVSTALYAASVSADGGCANLGLGNKSQIYATLRQALSDVVGGGGNGGLNNNMWASIVDRDGKVCAVARSGDDRGDQWPGSRVISAQKANTGNAFSLPSDVQGFPAPLSTGNLYEAVQPGGSLFGLQHSNPVDTASAYGQNGHGGGNAAHYGTANDPLVGDFVGGVNVFGGGAALYKEGKTIVGALGVSGDTSCTDHIVAWKVRHALNLDDLPGGVNNGTDNIYFGVKDANGHFGTPTPPPVGVVPGFAHPQCFDVPGNGDHVDIINDLPTDFAIGPAP